MRGRPHPAARLLALLLAFLYPGLASQSAAAELLCATVAQFDAAVRAARPGDAILLREGTWTDADLRFEAEGTATQPITLRAATPGRVVLTGASRLRIGGSHLVVDGLRFERCVGPRPYDVIEFRAGSSPRTGVARHCRLTHTAVVDCNPPSRDTNTRWVSLYGSDNRVDHCYFAGKTNVGATLVVWLAGEVVRHRIDRNHFGPRPPLGINGGESIRIGDSRTSGTEAQCVVEENLFTACDGEVEIISNKSCGNTYRANTFVESAGTLTLRHGHRNLVIGNFFLGRGKAMTGGIRVINEDQRVFNNYLADLRGEGTYAALCLMNGIPNGPPEGYDQVRRAVIAFNTIVDCRAGIVLGYQSPTRHEATAAPHDVTFANNLVTGGGGRLLFVQSPPTAVRWRGNLFFGSDEPRPDANGIRRADPGLRLAPDGLRRPGPASPAIGAATDDGAEVRDDIDGQPRPVPRDIGCDQLSTAPVLRRPLAPADTGPAWRR